MKVKCISNEQSGQHLTLGKVYDVYEERDQYYNVINDVGRPMDFFKYRFEIVKESSQDNMQSLIKELLTINFELDVMVSIYDDHYDIHSWFGVFSVDSEQEVIEALQEMLKLVKKFKGD